MFQAHPARTTVFEIGGMTCNACATHVSKALEHLPGMHSAQVSYPRVSPRCWPMPRSHWKRWPLP